MTILWILAALAALILLGGVAALDYICVRHKEPDYTDPEVLRASPFAKTEPLVEAGKKWMAGQQVEFLQAVAYDGKLLSARFIAHENAKGTLLFFHGYRSSYVIDFLGVLEFYYDLGYNLLLCDQRAHGRSEGRFITYGVRERRDVVSWTNVIGMMFGENHPMFLVGLSMGASTVLMASSLELYGNVRGVLADCGFTSPGEIIAHVAKHRMHLPAGILLPVLNVFTKAVAGFGLHEASALDALAETKLPVLLVHGTGDRFVPCEMSRRSYEACRSEKELLLVEGAGHGQSFVVEPERYKKTVVAFLEKHLTDGENG